jgi:hypothetical protein
MHKRWAFDLTDAERSELEAVTRRGNATARKIAHTRVSCWPPTASPIRRFRLQQAEPFALVAWLPARHMDVGRV